MAYREQTREDDERDLTWLSMRDEGYSTSQIAKQFGVTSSRVRTVTNRITDAAGE